LGTLPLPFGSVVFVSSGSYSYPYVRPQSQQQFDLCDQMEEELEATQSKASVRAALLAVSDQVRHGARLTFQSLWVILAFR
jgi:hypothetical protein